MALVVGGIPGSFTWVSSTSPTNQHVPFLDPQKILTNDLELIYLVAFRTSKNYEKDYGVRV